MLPIQEDIMKILRATVILLPLLVLVLPLVQGRIWAAETAPAQAMEAAQGWLALDASPLDRPTESSLASRVESFADPSGRVLYHAVNLAEGGVVIVAGDDRLQPVIAWLPGAAELVLDASSPLRQMLDGDLAGRLDQAEADIARATPRAHPLWERLYLAARASSLRGIDTEDLTDLRVDALVESKWSQSGAYIGGNYLNVWNYSTPNHYPCGCVATAMAQLMRFHQFPVEGVGEQSATIYVDGTSETRDLLGGDGVGGAYDWSSMVLVTGSSTTTTQRQAIGALTHDAGVSVNMSYTSSGSGADTSYAANRLKNVFGYANAIANRDYSYNNFSGQFDVPINSNLDAGLPVLLGITGDGGHAIVCDGYGFQNDTPYHHLNMGWAGTGDVWYNLPIIETIYSFDTLYKLIFNVFPEATGEIISGRVLDPDGAPLAGASVTAAITGGGSWNAVTNGKGVFAFAGVPSNSAYTLSASLTGYSFEDASVSTGKSTDSYSYSCGNVWGEELVGTVTSGGGGAQNADILTLMLPVLNALNKQKL